MSPRPKCLKTSEPAINQQQNKETMRNVAEDSSNSANQATHMNDSHTVNPVSGQSVAVKTTGDGIGFFNTPTEIPGEVPGFSGSLTLIANAYGDSSHEDSAAAVGVSPSPVTNISCSNEKHKSEESHLARAAESVAATTINQTTACEANIPVIGTPGISGNLEEHKSEEDSHIAQDAECFASTTIDQTAPCEKKNGEMGYLLLGKDESEVYSDEMEVESVELNESDNRSNGIIDDMIIDEHSTEICPGKQLEKERHSSLCG